MCISSCVCLSFSAIKAPLALVEWFRKSLRKKVKLEKVSFGWNVFSQLEQDAIFGISTHNLHLSPALRNASSAENFKKKPPRFSKRIRLENKTIFLDIIEKHLGVYDH